MYTILSIEFTRNSIQNTYYITVKSTGKRSDILEGDFTTDKVLFPRANKVSDHKYEFQVKTKIISHYINNSKVINGIIPHLLIEDIANCLDTDSSQVRLSIESALCQEQS